MKVPNYVRLTAREFEEVTRKARERPARGAPVHPSVWAFCRLYYPPEVWREVAQCARHVVVLENAREGERLVAPRYCGLAWCPLCVRRLSAKVAWATYRRFQTLTPLPESVRAVERLPTLSELYAAHGPDLKDMPEEALAPLSLLEREGVTPRVGNVVLTFPPALQRRLTTREGMQMARVAASGFLDYLLPEGQWGAILNVHPLGEGNLLARHIHFDILVNGYYLPRRGQGGKNGDGSPWRIKKDWWDFTLARDTWRDILRDAFPRDAPRIPEEVNLYLNLGPKGRRLPAWRTQPGQVRHLINYSTRYVFDPTKIRLDPAREAPRNVLYHTGPSPAYSSASSTTGDEVAAAEATLYDGDALLRHLLEVDSWNETERRVPMGYLAKARYGGTARRFGNHRILAKPPPSGWEYRMTLLRDPLGHWRIANGNGRPHPLGGGGPQVPGGPGGGGALHPSGGRLWSPEEASVRQEAFWRRVRENEAHARTPTHSNPAGEAEDSPPD